MNEAAHYLYADMGHYDGYTKDDFEDLLKILSTIKGKFLLSSYPSDLLTQYTEEHKWHTITHDCNLSISNKGTRKIEVLTANYDINSMVP